MEFPLDMLTGYFLDQGITVVKEPRHPKALFSWVSAFLDQEAPQAAEGEDDTMRFMGPRALAELREAGAPGRRVVVIGPREDVPEVPALGNDDIYIRSALSPELLADRVQRHLMRIVQWNDQMGAMLEDGCITQDLLKASEPVLGCFVALSDSTFSYIAHTPNISPIDERTAYLVKNGCYSPDTIRIAREHGLMRTWEHQEWTAVHNGPTPLFSHPTLDHVIRQHGRYAAHLIMVSPTEISTCQVFLFNLLAKKVEACLERHWRLENPLEQSYSYFLRELLAGNVYDDPQLAEHAKLHGLPLTGLFELCVSDNTWRAGSPNYFAKKILETEPSCKVAVNGQSVAVLLCAPDLKRGRIAAMEEEVFRLAHRMRVEVGVSDRFEQLDEAALALEKARIALRYGRRKSRRFLAFDPPGTGTEEIFRFRRYFPYFATDPFARPEKFATKLLASPNPLTNLRAADKERGTNDAEILRVYLHAEGRINVVCEQMHMHRNTVTYRLDKIRKLVRGDLDDADLRLYLRMLYLLSD